MSFQKLKSKIESKKVTVGIVGLGYVGLPLAVEFARAGVKVIGIDVSPGKISSLKSGTSYVEDVPSSAVAAVTGNGTFKPHRSFRKLRKADAVIICVPTPLRKSRDPDLSYIVKASRAVAECISADTLVILESTSYPGTTGEILVPALEKQRLKAGRDVFVAFSPERVDPGNSRYGIRNTPKVVGGYDEESAELAGDLYRIAVDRVVFAGSCEEAEMVKLLENTFRAVNIGLINEMAQLCDRFGLDIWRIIRAAASKPFGFMPFYPGPGLGGHCIPVDPQFLSWKAKSSRFYPYFIDYADEINRSMPAHVTAKASEILNESRRSVNGSKILLMGVSYKQNVGDVRESPAFEIADELLKLNASVSYTDPHVGSFMSLDRVDHKTASYATYNLVIIVTAHDDFDYKKILKESSWVLDCRGVTLDMEGKAKVRRI